MKDKWIHYIATGFGSGLAPIAPGTFGTFIGIFFIPIISFLPWYLYIMFILLTFIFGIYICDAASKYLQKHDAPEIVWDEFVGIWITLFLCPINVLNCFIGFLFFRFFDILKPYPISYVDRKIENGFGIMFDDVLAGILSFICMQILLKFQII